jgi:hypothetical protein
VCKVARDAEKRGWLPMARRVVPRPQSVVRTKMRTLLRTQAAGYRLKNVLTREFSCGPDGS